MVNEFGLVSDDLQRQLELQSGNYEEIVVETTAVKREYEERKRRLYLHSQMLKDYHHTLVRFKTVVGDVESWFKESTQDTAKTLPLEKDRAREELLKIDVSSWLIILFGNIFL